MAVTVQIRHFIPPSKRAFAGPLLGQVRELIRLQNGHFYTEVLSTPEGSAFSIENITWSSMLAWKTWESSHDWKTAKARIEKLLKAKTECAVVATAAA